MEEKKEYLNESKNQKTSKTLFCVGIGIIALGVVIFLSILIPKLVSRSKWHMLN